ncbi:MAG: PhzF family phenazine biosynthesis protein [Candidatus Omnitrophica bacterium]|nr:PhzF family phenazine biosynthesis protein [Candidatus Omnitrophota bacterium]
MSPEVFHQELFQVDAFTDKPFHGNPAAVCVLSEPREEAWMQNVAMEMNLSETAFIIPRQDGFTLRWFTPACEVDLCGHATLAGAHILWETGRLPQEREARFYAKSGILTAKRSEEGIEMDFPAEPAAPADCPLVLAEALGFSSGEIECFKNRMDYLLALESEEALRRLQPDFTRLAQVDMRGVIATSPSSAVEYDFVSRFFAPGVGVNEDPVTGSAHCCLAPFWGERFRKDSLTGYQASKRGGAVRVQCKGDRVLVTGRAVTVMRIRLNDNLG